MFTSVHFSRVKFLSLKVQIFNICLFCQAVSQISCQSLLIMYENPHPYHCLYLLLPALVFFPPPPINYSRVFVASHYWFNLQFSIMLNTFSHVCWSFRNPLLWNFYISVCPLFCFVSPSLIDWQGFFFFFNIFWIQLFCWTYVSHLSFSALCFACWLP